MTAHRRTRPTRRTTPWIVVGALRQFEQLTGIGVRADDALVRDQTTAGVGGVLN